jgi:hydroxymethylbilane synthase
MRRALDITPLIFIRQHMNTNVLRIASRESPLAMVQSEWAAAQLRAFHPGLDVSIIGMTTKGDQILDKPLAQIGGKGLFIKELEVAIEEGRADIAVHSMKDVPMVMPPGFALMTVGLREDIRDAFVSNKYRSLDELPAGAVVGTSSLRRESQIRHFHPGLKIAPLRGNVNTRLRKLDDGEFDAVILAAAGLKRLGFGDRIRNTLDTSRYIPAVAQGALGIEYADNRADVPALLAPFANVATKAMVDAERAFGRRLSASCDVPLGATATVNGGTLSIAGFVATPDGSRRIAATQAGGLADAETIGTALAEQLLVDGADKILESLLATAGRTLAPPSAGR